MNKKVASEIAVGVILLLALIIGGVYKYANTDIAENQQKWFYSN